MEHEIGTNISERMADRDRPTEEDASQETIPTDDVDEASIGAAEPSVDDV